MYTSIDIVPLSASLAENIVPISANILVSVLLFVAFFVAIVGVNFIAATFIACMLQPRPIPIKNDDDLKQIRKQPVKIKRN
ncbi:hypothetical protein CL622_02020 [archaeon]|nr:hypothetical protein [archaeon]